MKTEAKAWPGEKVPTKEEIERMYWLAYCVDPDFFRREDVVDFGLDLYRLKEFGQVRMSKGLGVLRRHATALWKRLSDTQRAAYILGDIISGLRYVDGAVRELEKVMGEFPEAHEGVDFIYHQLFAKLPLGLRNKLEKGFGKWKQKA
jgi:hypothetical protein